MIRTTIIAIGLLTAGAASAQAVHPMKVPQSEAMSAVFQRPTATSRAGENGRPATKTFPMLASADKALTSGVYEAGASDNAIESYRVDEFMFFIKGGVKLTSADGTVTDIGPGDAVTIPKGWKGRWTTPGYTKYFVIYNPK
jgi:uncharacterized cupin superfamily protein